MPLPPVVSVNWSVSQAGVSAPYGWNISNSGNTIRFDVQDSANCGGPNGNVQSGTALATLTAQARFNMSVSLTGLGESQDPGFENMTLRFNGTNIITATSPGGGQGCAVGGPVSQTILVPGPYFLAKDSNNSFQLTFTTRDNLYHVGCFYQCNLTFTLLDPPEIFNFSASPNPQTSGALGVPSNTTQLSWSTFGAETLSINQGIGDLSSISGSTGTISTGLQSIEGSNSPATKTYTLTATNSAGTVTSQTTVSVYNDNTPNNFTIPDQNNVEPNSAVVILSPNIQGIDMITTVTGGPGVQVSNNGNSYSNTITITNNQQFYIRVFSLPFNQDPSGLTNSTSYYVDVGPTRRSFTVTTRAPDVSETFNLSNKDDTLPYPDIDTLPGSPDQYIISDPVTIDDVEIDVEVKTSNPNVQVRIKESGSTTFGSWQNVRST
jgi:hypothetical protein